MYWLTAWLSLWQSLGLGRPQGAKARCVVVGLRWNGLASSSLAIGQRAEPALHFTDGRLLWRFRLSVDVAQTDQPADLLSACRRLHLGARSHPRQPSTPLYTLFSPSQIKQFREAFNLIDVDRDGLISLADLSSTLANFGLPASSADLASYLPPSTAGAAQQQQQQLSFTQFLTMMGDKLLRMDKDDVVGEAFASFDASDEGVVRIDELREWLQTTGDKLSDDEVRCRVRNRCIAATTSAECPPALQMDALLSSRFADHRKGTFDYREFVKSLKVNEPADDDDGEADDQPLGQSRASTA